MKKINLLVFTFLMLAIVQIGVVSGQSVEAEWTNPNYGDRTFSKIAVVAINPDIEAVNLFESLAVKQLRKKGINAIVGSTIFPSPAKVEDIDSGEILKIITRNQLDGVITFTLVKTVESVKYQPGQIYSVGVGKKALGVYWITNYKTIQDPGEFELTKSYIIEANLFDLKGDAIEDQETLVWKGQSALDDPESREKAANKFTKPMIKYLLKKGIIKK